MLSVQNKHKNILLACSKELEKHNGNLFGKQLINAIFSDSSSDKGDCGWFSLYECKD